MDECLRNIRLHVDHLKVVDVLSLERSGDSLVCKAVDIRPSTARFVAVKCIRRGALGIKGHKTLERDILTHRMLDHANIITQREVFLTPSHLCISYDYGGAKTVEDHVKAYGHLSERLARQLFRQMVSAIDHLHRKALINRDINLRNFLVNSNSVVQMCDPGSAKPGRWSFSSMQSDKGSPAYKAPELWAGMPYGETADMWSLGVCLLVMLLGQDLPMKRLIPGPGTPPLWESEGKVQVSDGAKDILSGLLKIDPATRMAMWHLKDHPWLAEGEEISRSYNTEILTEELRQETMGTFQSKEEVLEILDASKKVE